MTSSVVKNCLTDLLTNQEIGHPIDHYYVMKSLMKTIGVGYVLIICLTDKGKDKTYKLVRQTDVLNYVRNHIFKYEGGITLLNRETDTWGTSDYFSETQFEYDGRDDTTLIEMYNLNDATYKVICTEFDVKRA